MQIETLNLVDDNWVIGSTFEGSKDADFVTVFGDSDLFTNSKYYEELKQRYPNAHILGCSSSGNIMGAQVSKSSMVVTAIKFKNAKVQLHTIDFNQGDDIANLSEQLAKKFELEGLKHLFLLADGLNLNGSELVGGFNKIDNLSITGGLAGDGARFEQTWVIADDIAKQRRIAAVGFYGESLTISSGCYGGWSEFGTQRVITKSKDNILYEIDNEPALDLYKRYLGSYADDLPNSGLRFPLSIREDDNSPEIIRTLLGINEEEKSITFAGNLPEGYKAKLMKPDIDELISGAGKAAEIINMKNTQTALGLVVSCVGRKVVMSQLVDEELEAVAEELGENVQLTGFYSYGEIAPFENGVKNCELHNQTMTLTVIYED